MDVLECFEELVDNVSFVDFFKDAATDDNMQIRFHVVEYEVEVLVVFCFDDILEPDDVVVICHFLKEHDLPEGSLCICGIVECIEDLLKCDSLV